MPPRRGQVGYREWCLAEIDAGRCTCQDCGGSLIDERCRICTCEHFVQVQGTRRYAAWIPGYGRCPDADRQLAEWTRQVGQDERRRRRAEALGDPQG